MRQLYIVILTLALALVPMTVTANPGQDEPGFPVGIAAAPDWWTRGRSDQHQNAILTSSSGIADQEAWSLELGLSATQPLYVDGKIYHLGGDSLWEIDPTALPEGTHDVPVACAPGILATNPTISGVRCLATRINGWPVSPCLTVPVGSLPGSGCYRPSSAGMTYRKVQGRPALYFGTGGNHLCAFRFRPGEEPRCMKLGGSEPITGTPLVFLVRQPAGNVVDIAIIGDKAGMIWAAQGLATALDSADVGVTGARIPGAGAWITASPTPVRPGIEVAEHPGNSGETDFLWAADGVDLPEGKGAYGRWRALAGADGYPVIQMHDENRPGFCLPLAASGENQGCWWKANPAGERAGFTDGFAVATEMVSVHDALGQVSGQEPRPVAYLSDKQGNLLRVDLNQGVEKRVAVGGTDPVFMNSMAAYDAQRVYFTVRNGSSADPRRDNPGRLVAVNRATWQLAGEADLRSVDPKATAVNTNPLVWYAGGGGRVLLGDTAGRLYALDAATMKPTSLLRSAGELVGGRSICYSRPVQPLLRPGEEAFTAQFQYQQLNGTGTDPILISVPDRDQTLLIVGVNAQPQGARLQPPVDPLPATGRLVAYPTVAGYNFGWIGATTAPADGVAFGSSAVIGRNVQLADAAASRLTTVWWFVENQETGHVRLVRKSTVSLMAGATARQSLPYTPLAVDGEKVRIHGFVNVEDLILSMADEGGKLRELTKRALAGNGLTASVSLLLTDFDSAALADPAVRKVAREALTHLNLTGACRPGLVEAEDNAADNYTFTDITVTRPVIDLAVTKLIAPGTFTRSAANPLEGYSVSYEVANLGNSKVDAVITVRLNGCDDDDQRNPRLARVPRVSLASGGSYPGTATVSPPGYADVLVCVKVAALDVVEPPGDLTNNWKDAVTQVNGPGGGNIGLGGGGAGGGGGLAGGQRDSGIVIVPSDCQADTNPDRSTPCLNHPHLRARWFCDREPDHADCRRYRAGQ